MIKKILLLGGTSESADLARKASFSLEGKATVITSLAGRLKPNQDIPNPKRIGGFGGIEGLQNYIKNENIDMLVDATHPFAETISTNAYVACSQTQVPRLALIRPPWQFSPNSKWIDVDDIDEAAEILPRFSKRAFLTVGKRGIEAFSKVKGVWFLARLMESTDALLPLADYRIITGRPPFFLENEQALIKDHQIDTLVTKQSGGKTGKAKIIAAQEAGIKIIIINRPPTEPGDRVETVEEALAWISKNL